jgi:GDP-mannose 6-dehydrogenase
VVDPEAVMAVLRADPARNLGPTYLRPGGPYGGSCLGKDLAALLAHAGGAGLALPALAGAAASNGLHGRWLADRIRARVPPPGPVLQVGLSFKAGTDDLRRSPLLELARSLAASGYALALHDPDLAPARLRAACRSLGASARPSPEEAVAAAGAARLVLLGKPAPGLAARLPPGVEVVELAGLAGFRAAPPAAGWSQ